MAAPSYFPAVFALSLSALLLAAKVVTAAETLKYKLNDGNRMPAIALGTSLGHLSDGTRILPTNKSVVKAVQSAIEFGYRHIDTASLYRVEDEVGEGIANKIADGTVTREDIFVTTKVWNDMHERAAVVTALRESLARLRLDYVDLYLMHYPMAYTKSGEISSVDYLETWLGLEDARTLNLTRSIGVSNFNVSQLERLYAHARLKPAVQQVEVNPSLTQDELVSWCAARGVAVMAYSPFGALFGRKRDAPPPRADHPLLLQLAAKYNKTSAQIVLRYLLDRHLAPIPRSTNPKRIAENFSILDFSLSPEEVLKISAFNSNYRLRTPAKWYAHPDFPFEKKNLTAEEIKFIVEHSVED